MPDSLTVSRKFPVTAAAARLLLAAVFCAACGPVRGWAADAPQAPDVRNWLLLRGDGYDVMTDAGAASASRAAERVERLQALLGERSRVLPLRVLITSSAGLFRSLRPDNTSSGFYQSGAEADWVVVHWGSPDSERALAHEMVHASLEHSAPRRPAWLEEGLAEFYSTVSRQGAEWRLGQPIPEHVRLLAGAEWLDAETLFGLQPDSQLRSQPRQVALFYAQSWATVHYLLTAPDVRTRAPGLMEALGEGVPIERACPDRLGISPGELLARTRVATLRRSFPTVAVAPQYAPDPRRPPERLSPEQAAGRLLHLAVAAGRPAAASRLAASSGPVVAGLYALSQSDRRSAEARFREATRAGSPEATPYFELAMLLREAGREAGSKPGEVEGLLRQALKRQPNLAEAHFVLGLAESARQDHETAIGYFQSAARILPRQATFWHALTLELHRAGRLAEARHAALRCRTAACNTAEREMAAALDGLLRPSSSPSPSQPPVHVPESWRGLRGDTSASGDFTFFDCGTTPPQFRMRTAEGELLLSVQRPGEIQITGGDGLRHTFTCGPQSVRARVEYRKATGELTAVEFLP